VLIGARRILGIFFLLRTGGLEEGYVLVLCFLFCALLYFFHVVVSFYLVIFHTILLGLLGPYIKVLDPPFLEPSVLEKLDFPVFDVWVSNLHFAFTLEDQVELVPEISFVEDV